MATYLGAEDGTGTQAFTFNGRVAAAFEHAPQFTPQLVISPSALDVPQSGGLYFDVGSKSSFAPLTFLGSAQDEMSAAIDWFEDFHVVPRSFALGNIISTQLVAVEVYSAFRSATHTWDAWINNAGPGVTLIGGPSLPYSFFPQTGLQMDLQVSTSGLAIVDSTLDWVFDIGTIVTPITFQRVVLFSMPPEMPYSETLEFLTDIHTHKDGSEKRAALRKNPRQFFMWEVMLEEGPERARIENILFDWQTRIFGVPVWHELTNLTTNAAALATSINVSSTAFADYRVNGLVLIYESQTKYDVLTLASLTGTSLTFTSGLLNSYSAGVNVMVCPLRTGVIDGPLGETRYPVNLSRLQVQFRIQDNDANLASTAAWSTLFSKVFLSEINCLPGTLGISFDQDIVVLDSKTGIDFRETSWPNNRRGSAKTFITNTRQGVWNIRQLMHALRGRQVSFYLPTFAKDLELASPIVNGTNQLVVTNVGYAQFVRSRQPRNVIRVIPNTGAAAIVRTVTAATDGIPETLTVDSPWAAGFTAAQISRIEYIEKIRLDSDRVRFDYNLGDRSVRVNAPVKAVLE